MRSSLPLRSFLFSGVPAFPDFEQAATLFVERVLESRMKFLFAGVRLTHLRDSFVTLLIPFPCPRPTPS